MNKSRGGDAEANRPCGKWRQRPTSIDGMVNGRLALSGTVAAPQRTADSRYRATTNDVDRRLGRAAAVRPKHREQGPPVSGPANVYGSFRTLLKVFTCGQAVLARLGPFLALACHSGDSARHDP